MKKLSVIVALILAVMLGAGMLSGCAKDGNSSGGGASTADPSSSAQDQSSESSLPSTGVPEGLVDDWVTEDNSYVLSVGEDGSMAEGANYSEYVDFYTCSFSGNTLYRTDESGKHATISFELEDDVFTMQFEDGSVESYYRRGAADGADPFAGEWNAEDGAAVSFGDGFGWIVRDGKAGMFSYSVRESKVTIIDGEVDSYRFEISGDTLTFYSMETDEACEVFTRAPQE